jgi:hypothetical protein
MKEKFKLFWQNLLESLTACVLIMVQGNILAITLKHWFVATKTGLLTGIMAVAVAIFGNEELQHNKYALAGMTGFLTTIADFFVHPSHFGGQYTESIVTGIGAGLLCFALSHLNDKK